MRILLLIGSLELGGAETQLSLLAQGLVHDGHEVHFATFSAGGPLAPSLSAAGVILHNLSWPSTSRPRSLRLVLAQLRLNSLVRQLRPDVLQAYLPLTSLMGVIAGRMAGTRCIVIGRRALASHQDRVPSAKWIDWAANRLAHAITANSEAVRADHAARDGLPLDRIKVIPNAIEPARFENNPVRRAYVRKSLGLGENEIAILCVGNLIPYKGHDDLIEALGLLSTTHQNLHLFLAGRPEAMGEKLVALAAARNVTFTLLGPRNDVPDLLQAADLFVLPSHEEGSSNALLEAVIAGVPAVATRVGGNPALLLDGVGGRLCPARDPASMAEEIACALKDADDMRLRAERARMAALVGRSIKALVDRHMALYDSVRAANKRKDTRHV